MYFIEGRETAQQFRAHVLFQDSLGQLTTALSLPWETSHPPVDSISTALIYTYSSSLSLPFSKKNCNNVFGKEKTLSHKWDFWEQQMSTLRIAPPLRIWPGHYQEVVAPAEKLDLKGWFLSPRSSLLVFHVSENILIFFSGHSKECVYSSELCSLCTKWNRHEWPLGILSPWFHCSLKFMDVPFVLVSRKLYFLIFENIFIFFL